MEKHMPIACYNVDEAKRLKSINAAILLMWVRQQRANAATGGWFEASPEAIADLLAMPEWRFRTARKVLEHAGLIETTLTSTMPPRVLWRVGGGR